MTTGSIDVHSHYIAPAYRSALESVGKDRIGGIPVPPWTPELAIGFMDAHGIARQVLSVSDPGVDFLAGEAAAGLARECNDYLAGVVASHPDRFSGLAVVSGNDPEAALSEIARCFERPGFAGLGLLSSYDGSYLGDPAFDPLLTELDQRRAWVMVHPTAVPTTDKPDLTIPDFMAEYPFDTTRAFLNLLVHNAFARFPGIRWHFAHGGGTIPMLAARMDVAAAHGKVLGPLLGLPEQSADLGPESAREALAGCWYDTALIASEGGLQAVSAMTGTDHILFGCDWPFAGLAYPPEGDPQPAIGTLFGPDDQEAIYRANAEKLLAGLPQQTESA